jgi:hypothetical protein
MAMPISPDYPADSRLHDPRPVRKIKRLIWLYFWMLMFEGAVRKWIPPLSTPFLLIRDPIALVIWFEATRLNLIDKGKWAIFYCVAFGLTLLGLVQVIVVALPLPVFLYGWRSYVLHVPVIIIAANILNSDDVKKVGRWLLLLSLPMTLLMFAQYVAPPEGWLNRGASEGSSQIGSALGHVRPAGTFSFITGAASFEQLTAAFVFLGLAKKGLYPRWLTISAAIALAAVLPISGSRTLALGVLAVAAAAFAGALIRGSISFDINQIPRIIAGLVAACFILLALYQVPVVQNGVTTFMTRWNTASEGEGEGSGTVAVEARLLGPFIYALDTAALAPPFGNGMGLGSNFGAVYTGVGGLALGESPWDREVNELGPLPGLFFLALRVVLGASLIVMSYRVLRRGVLLPLYLMPTAALAILIGALGQPTSQGFLVILAALSWVALRGDPQVLGGASI